MEIKMLRVIGVGLIILSLALIVYGFSMSVTNGYYDKMYNVGLLSEREISFTIGSLIGVVGALTLFIDEILLRLDKLINVVEKDKDRQNIQSELIISIYDKLNK